MLRVLNLCRRSKKVFDNPGNFRFTVFETSKHQPTALSSDLLNSMDLSSSRVFSSLSCTTSPRCQSIMPSQRVPRRGVATTLAMATERSDLQVVRGVGPVNASLLKAKNIASVHQLQEIYHLNFKADRQQMEQFLYDVVGIRNLRHCKSIAEHMEGMSWEGVHRRVKLAVEGNIGAGKSTFLDIMADGQLELQDILEIIPEPVEEWQNVQSGNKQMNLLEQFYRDPKRYAYTFQHYVLLTRMQKDRLSRSSTKPLQVLERSIFSDRMVFVRAMHEAGFMQDLELSVYDSWFNMEIGSDHDLTPNGFIYLKAKPETCIKRLRNRNRSEEVGVTEEYLANLHDKHESWLHFGARNLDKYVSDEQNLIQTVSRLQYQNEMTSPLLLPNGLPASAGIRLGKPDLGQVQDAPESIRDDIYILNSGTSSITDGGKANLDVLDGVPALVLDHEQEHIMYDLEARREYAKKVQDFSQYVGKLYANKRPRALTVDKAYSDKQVHELKMLMDEFRKLLETQSAGKASGQIQHLNLLEQRLQSL